MGLSRVHVAGRGSQSSSASEPSTRTTQRSSAITRRTVAHRPSAAPTLRMQRRAPSEQPNESQGATRTLASRSLSCALSCAFSLCLSYRTSWRSTWRSRGSRHRRRSSSKARRSRPGCETPRSTPGVRGVQGRGGTLAQRSTRHFADRRARGREPRLHAHAPHGAPSAVVWRGTVERLLVQGSSPRASPAIHSSVSSTRSAKGSPRTLATRTRPTCKRSRQATGGREAHRAGLRAQGRPRSFR